VRRRRLRILGLLLLLALPGLARAAAPRPSVADLLARDDQKALAALGPAALPELVRLYSSGTDDQKVRIANVFYQLGRRSPEAERALLRDAHSANPDLRIAVQYALGRVSDDPKVVDTLLDIMRHDGSPVFRDKAACALSYDQIHLTEAQKVRLYEGLIGALEDPKPQVQVIAIQALSILTGQDKGFRRFDPPDKKRQSIEAWRRWLAEYRTNL
jgi:HEAT repeat protein